MHACGIAKDLEGIAGVMAKYSVLELFCTPLDAANRDKMTPTPSGSEHEKEKSIIEMTNKLRCIRESKRKQISRFPTLIMAWETYEF